MARTRLYRLASQPLSGDKNNWRRARGRPPASLAAFRAGAQICYISARKPIQKSPVKFSSLQQQQQTNKPTQKTQQLFFNSDNKPTTSLKMNKIFVALALFAMFACAFAQYGGYQQSYHQPEERKWIQIPALKLNIGSDKLMFRLPNLGSLFQSHREPEYEHHY